MRVSSLIPVVIAVGLLVSAAAPAAATFELECKPDTGFGATNPSYYVCEEPGRPLPGDECYRWGVRPYGQGMEGRGCVGP